MMVSGISSSTMTMFSNYRTSSATNSTSIQSETESQKGARGAGGPPPPPGGGKGGGPEVDTNGDSVWDADELTSLSEELSESGATSFSVDELLETYDTDEDGVISASESEGIKENNAFNLTPMKDMSQVMMNGSRGLQIQEASAEDFPVTSDSDQAIKTMISAYLQQSESFISYYNLDLDVTTD